MDAYCMKCKTKREIRSPAQVTLKNGGPTILRGPVRSVRPKSPG